MRSVTIAVPGLVLLLTYALLPSSSSSASASPAQAVFQADPLQPAHPASHVASSRKPFGRFLHVTDLHPDTHYKYGSAVSAACHHNKPKPKKPEGKKRAGWWGSALSDCDSPPRLIESSLAWAARNLFQPKSDVNQLNGTPSDALGLDFVIWTGDSARHDNDNKLPRSSKEIFELNRWTLSQLETAFPGVPLLPTVGNNDIFPHNILFPGPNPVTKEYVQIWRDHIPEYEFHTFEQGGYYVKEIIPNRLAAMSLNTLYFYDTNRAVDGCVRTKKKGDKVDPGTAQLEWLEVQLDLFRQRGMQVHLLGHVPPTAGNYFERCYRRYTDIVLRFQDTVVGQHFGHMNVDAFFIQEDAEAVAASNVEEREVDAPATAKEVLHVTEEGLPGDLKQDYSTLPGKGRTNEDLYSVFYIAPSIIPTFYPSMRLWTYNTTEEARYVAQASATSFSLVSDEDEDEDEDEDAEERENRDEIEPLSRHHHRPSPPKKRKGKKHKKKHKKRPRHASPDSPARTNTYLSLLGYSQWVMDMDEQNEAVEKILHPHTKARLDIDTWDEVSSGKEGKKKEPNKDKDGEEERKRRKEAEKSQVSCRLEYATYPPEVLWREFNPDWSTASPPGPVPKRLLEKELERAGVQHPYPVSSKEEDAGRGGEKINKGGKRKLAKPLRKLTDYSLGSLTVGEMMDLARKLMVDKKLWKRYKKRIYSESGYTP